MKHLVAIATYRRPAGLRRLLHSLEGEPGTFDVAVVDNDPDQSARPVVAASGTSRQLIYLPEPEPGIAAARNRAIAFAVANDYHTLAFVDDDESIVKGWFAALAAAQTNLDADVVCGPVVPAYEPGVPGWAAKGGFFDRPRQQTGTVPRWPATNNVIIRLTDDIRSGVVAFRQQNSLAGGSDTDFFAELAERGARLAWCDEAIVVEHVPPSRASIGWLWRRGLRLGNVTSRRMARAGRGWAVVPVGLARIVLAAPLAVAGFVRRGPRGLSALMHLPKGVGMLQRAFGGRTIEYRR
jgi:glycosyltransferase involved in cell wall biosynthesis